LNAPCLGVESPQATSNIGLAPLIARRDSERLSSIALVRRAARPAITAAISSWPICRKPLVTLRDAVKHMTGLPRAEQNAEHWRPAATLLAIIGEKGGCMFFAELAVRHGLRKGVKGVRGLRWHY
jgi:hypothetical protein